MRRTRQLTAAVAVAALLLLAGCSGSLASGGGDAAGERTVQVGATGAVETAPDRATVRVAVVATGDDVRAVREGLAENSSAMREALEAEGYNVTSARYDIDRNHRRERRRSERERERDTPGFVGRHAFVVRVDDPDAAGDAVVTAVENGATRVERVTFGASEATRRELRERALAEAMENARAEAEIVAESGDLRLTGVAAASTVSVDAEPVVRREAARAAADGAGGGSPTRIDAGTVTVRAQVYVTYNATAA